MKTTAKACEACKKLKPSAAFRNDSATCHACQTESVEIDQAQRSTASGPRFKHTFDLSNAEARQQEVDVMRLRVAGVSEVEIAQKALVKGLDTVKDVRRVLRRALRQMRNTWSQIGEDYRELLRERLDKMILALWKQMQQGDIRAGGQILQYIRELSDMYGLKAPLKFQSETTVKIDAKSMTDEQIDRYIQRLSSGNG
jgi:hypothetical protein